MHAPTIQTPRLRLRAHRADDEPACVAMWADPAIARATIGEPSSAAVTWRRMLVYGGLWALLGYGYWAIEERATRAYAGDVGFGDFRRDAGPVPAGEPEMGWALARAAQGRGLALEACRAALRWADERLAAPRVVCAIDRANVPSLRLAAKLGFAEIPLADERASGALVALERPRAVRRADAPGM